MTSPMPGWYTDPADAGRHRYWDGDVWTEKTRPGSLGTIPQASVAFASGDERTERSSRRTIAIVAAVAVGVAAIVGLGIALSGGNDKSPSTASSSLSDDPANTSGWVSFTSRSGAVEYLVDPSWTDIYTREDEESMYASTVVPGTSIELAGMWMQSGSLLSGGTVFVVTAVDDGVGSVSLKLESAMFATEFGSSLDDYEELTDEGWTTAAGDEAWRIDMSGTSLGEPLLASVVTISHDTTIVMAYAVSSDDFDGWIADFLAMCDSTVVVHPPTNL